MSMRPSLGPNAVSDSDKGLADSLAVFLRVARFWRVPGGPFCHGPDPGNHVTGVPSGGDDPADRFPGLVQVRRICSQPTAAQGDFPSVPTETVMIERVEQLR